MIAAAHPSPSPSPSIHLHLPASLKHVHVSPGLIVLAAVVLGGLFVISRLARRARKGSEGDSSGGWGNLTAGQDLAVVVVSALGMGLLAFLLSSAMFIGLSVLICIASGTFTVTRLFGAGPLVQKWQRTVDKDGNEGWRELFSVGPHGPRQ